MRYGGRKIRRERMIEDVCMATDKAVNPASLLSKARFETLIDGIFAIAMTIL